MVIKYDYEAKAQYTKAINDAVDAASEILIFKVRNDSAYFKNGVYSNNVPVLTRESGENRSLFQQNLDRTGMDPALYCKLTEDPSIHHKINSAS